MRLGLELAGAPRHPAPRPAGTATRNVAPPPGVSLTVDGAVQRLDDRGDDRQAEPGAAGLAGARGVGAPEPLEDLLADLLGDALAVVDDLDPAHAGGGVDADAQLDRGVVGGEPARVAEQIRDHLADAVLVAQHDRAASRPRRAGRRDRRDRGAPRRPRHAEPPRPGAACAAGATARRRRPGRCADVGGPLAGARSAAESGCSSVGRRRAAAARSIVVSITVTGRSGEVARTSSAASRAIGRRSTGADHDVAPLVEAREGEQVLDEHAHPHRLLLDAVHRLRDILVARDRAHPVQLGVAAHRDERGAQLVAGVADESAHLPHRRVALRDRAVHPAEHRVDRGLEAADLGRRRLDVGHALAEVARRRSPSPVDSTWPRLRNVRVTSQRVSSAPAMSDDHGEHAVDAEERARRPGSTVRWAARRAACRGARVRAPPAARRSRGTRRAVSASSSANGSVPR